jgi:hypothetical protein
MQPDLASPSLTSLLDGAEPTHRPVQSLQHSAPAPELAPGLVSTNSAHVEMDT